MERYSHAQIAALETRSWWYATRRSLLDRLMRDYGAHGVGLDVGCGVGSNYSTIAAHATRVIGLDNSAEALEHTGPYDEKILSGVEAMPLPDGSVDFAVCADVLEHVDDHAAVSEIYRVLRTNGTLFVMVPAFESLWNENDDYGHHLRRYRKSQLLSLFDAAKFSVEYCYYWDRLPFPFVWLLARFYRRGQKKSVDLRNNLHRIPEWFDSVLYMWMRFENALARIIPMPFGVSLVLVVRKQS